MDSDQDSVDNLVVLAALVHRHHPASSTTSSRSRSRSRSAIPNSDPDHASAKFLGLLAYTAAAADPDDPEGMYTPSDFEDTYATPPPSLPLPKPQSGLFHHTLTGEVAYAAFDPVPLPDAAHDHNVGKQLVSDPTFAAFVTHEPVAALVSTWGLVCLRGTVSNAYYVANPATFRHESLPAPARDHRAKGDPAVVITLPI